MPVGRDPIASELDAVSFTKADYHIKLDWSKRVIVRVWVAGHPQRYEEEVFEDFENHRTKGMVIEPYPSHI